MKNRPSERAVTAWARLLRVQTRLLDEVNATLKAAGLPALSWYDVLYELHGAGERELRQYEIGVRTLLPKSNLSRLIDRLEAEQLVRRRTCPEDGRGNVIQITAAGRRLLKRMWPVYGAFIHAQFESRLSPAELVALGDILGKLLEGPAPGAEEP